MLLAARPASLLLTTMPPKKRAVKVKAAPSPSTSEDGSGRSGDWSPVAAKKVKVSPTKAARPAVVKKKKAAAPAPAAADPAHVGPGDPVLDGWVSMHANGVPFVMWK